VIENKLQELREWKDRMRRHRIKERDTVKEIKYRLRDKLLDLKTARKERNRRRTARQMKEAFSAQIERVEKLIAEQEELLRKAREKYEKKKK
jgi:hypothetical protein